MTENVGWRCCVCGSVWAPFTDRCEYCYRSKEKELDKTVPNSSVCPIWTLTTEPSTVDYTTGHAMTMEEYLNETK